MMIQEDKDISVLFARLDDLYRSADQGILGGTSFLSPRELHFAMAHLRSRGQSSRVIEWGGYSDAERKKLFVWPEYMEGITDVAYFSDYGFDVGIAGVSVLGSGYRTLSHRDFLGSVLGLGLERDALGDILIYGEQRPRALIICSLAVADFICDNLKKVASDTVSASIADLAKVELPERKFLHISDTVASARLDAVVSSLLSVSREKAKDIVLSGYVEVDYELCERPDKTVSAPSTVTVRGAGKFRVNAISDLTKKGRLRLNADKYV